MFDKKLAIEILLQIQEGINRIQRRFEPISSSDDFLSTDDNLTKLDGICMMLITIGESLKNIDKVTHKTFLTNYPQVD